MMGAELQRPLLRAEIDDLASHLASTSGAMSLHEAHGFLTAIVSAPTSFQPSQWQRMMLGEGGFASNEHAQRIFGLVMRFYNAVVITLEARKRITPGESDDVAWCTGYLRCVRMDKVWMRTSVMSRSCIRCRAVGHARPGRQARWRRRRHRRPRAAAASVPPEPRVHGAGGLSPLDHAASREHDGARAGAEGRAQRAVSVRQRREVQEVLRAAGGVTGTRTDVSGARSDADTRCHGSAGFAVAHRVQRAAAMSGQREGAFTSSVMDLSALRHADVEIPLLTFTHAASTTRSASCATRSRSPMTRSARSRAPSPSRRARARRRARAGGQRGPPHPGQARLARGAVGALLDELAVLVGRMLPKDILRRMCMTCLVNDWRVTCTATRNGSTRAGPRSQRPSELLGPPCRFC